MPAGAAVIDVSPRRLKPGRIYMSGYKPNHFATEQADPIQARALALGGACSGLLVVVLDTCLLLPRMAVSWARTISRHVPLPPDRIFIMSTHTHSGPDLTWGFGGVPVEYFFQVRAGIIQAACMAWDSREDVELHVGVSSHSLGIPRRIKREKNEPDRDMVVLQWRNRGRPVATLMNLACHGVVFPRTSRLLSADLPGALCRKVDSEIGGVGLFAPRAQGDVNPDLPGDDPYEQKGDATHLARLAANGFESVKQALASAEPVDASTLEVQEKELGIHMRTPMSLLLSSAFWSGRVAFKPARVNVPLRKFRIGSVPGLAVPAEVLTCLGNAWLAQLQPHPALLLTCCNGWYGYLMTPDTFTRGGYETTVSPGPVQDTIL